MKPAPNPPLVDQPVAAVKIVGDEVVLQMDEMAAVAVLAPMLASLRGVEDAQLADSSSRSGSDGDSDGGSDGGSGGDSDGDSTENRDPDAIDVAPKPKKAAAAPASASVSAPKTLTQEERATLDRHEAQKWIPYLCMPPQPEHLHCPLGCGNYPESNFVRHMETRHALRENISLEDDVLLALQKDASFVMFKFAKANKIESEVNNFFQDLAKLLVIAVRFFSFFLSFVFFLLFVCFIFIHPLFPNFGTCGSWSMRRIS